MKYRDMRPAQPPVVEQSPAPSAPIVNDKYRGLANRQAEAENNYDRILGALDPVLAGEVVRRAAQDPRFSPEQRAGLDADGAALVANLAGIQREAKMAEIKQRLETARLTRYGARAISTEEEGEE